MNFLTITLTRIKKMPKHQPLPQVDAASAAEWFNGWWHGIAVGVVCGTAFGVIAGGVL